MKVNKLQKRLMLLITMIIGFAVSENQVQKKRHRATG
jgi:hypothetical protein